MIERERKFAVPASFVLPSFDDLGEGLAAVDLPAQRLDATYYDTADLRLVRSGITVRYRTGEGRSRWTVKLPQPAEGVGLTRREVDVPAPGKSVPAAVSSLVRAHVRSAELVAVGALRTERRRVEVRSFDEDGDETRTLAEIDDDEVTVRDGRRILLRFREVEVEGDAPTEVLDAIAERLKGAGASATDDQTPKIVRVLGPRALAPPEASPVPLDGSSTIGEVVQASLMSGLARLLEHDPGVRLGGDDEDVHQARVATRRLRSDLRTFRSVVLPDVAEPLRDELQWLAAVLGEVRDTDVLLDRLRGQASTLPGADADAGAALLARLSGERDAARRRLLEAMDSERYVELLDRLVLSAAAPPVDDGHVPARAALPGLVRGPWKHLQNAVESLDDHPADEALHDVRIRAKRTRYAAEASAGVIGKAATRLARAVAAVQTVLGDLNDAVVAEAWLRRAAAAATPPEAMVAGQLVAMQRAAMVESRAAWREAWDEASRKKLRSWLDG